MVPNPRHPVIPPEVFPVLDRYVFFGAPRHTEPQEVALDV